MTKITIIFSILICLISGCSFAKIALDVPDKITEKTLAMYTMKPNHKVMTIVDAENRHRKKGADN